MTQITAVTFDLWQTLLLDNRELGRSRAQVRLEGAQNALQKFGETYELEHIRLAYRACFQQCRRIREENRDVSFREQVAIFVENIDAGLVERVPPEVFQEILSAYADSFFVYPPLPHEDALRVLSSIKDMGLKIGLISNTGMTPGVAFRQFLGQHGLLEYFDVLTFSDEVKLAKPSRQIFEMTLDELGVRPAEVIHVGDHVKNDVVGAKQVGMKTIWIQGFYEREDASDPASEPDAMVSSLGKVVPAILELCGDQVSP